MRLKFIAQCTKYSSSRLYSALQKGFSHKFHVAKCIPYDDGDDDDDVDDGLIGKLFIFVCKRSKAESVSS